MLAHHTLKLEKNTLRKVTVFNDRAELRREFSVSLEKGQNEVNIENITNSIISDSVRVAGKGKVIIEEVQVTERLIKAGENDCELAKNIRSRVEELEESKSVLSDKIDSLYKRIRILNDVLERLANNKQEEKTDTTTPQLSISELSEMFRFYDDQSCSLRRELRENERTRHQIEHDIAQVRQDLQKFDRGEQMRVVSVIVEAEEAGPMILELCYQVSGPSWKPAYEIRVDTTEEKNTMQVTYLASLHQSTGEDWECASLTLSTARPSLGGSPPTLPTLDVSFATTHPQPMPINQMQQMQRGSLFGCGQAQSAMMSMPEASVFLADAAPPPPAEIRMATVSSQVLSTEFNIVRACSIPSDGVEHKVTIGIATLSPRLIHECAPSKNAAAFLTAVARNESAFAFLDGDAAVYIDGAFVGRTPFKAVSPGQVFSTSLGIDSAVSIAYPPSHRYNEQVGTIKKWMATIHEQRVIIKNAKEEPITLFLREQIPRSTDERIQVKIVEPKKVVEKKEKESEEKEETSKVERAVLLPSNNLEWQLVLNKGETRTVLIKYNIEYPLEQELKFVERTQRRNAK